MKRVDLLAYPALAVGIALAIGAYYISGYWQALLLTLVSVMLGFGIALLVVNGFLNRDERRKAAHVLMQMLLDDVAEYHNQFIRRGHDKFGIPAWNAIINVMNANRRNPDSLSPEQREGTLAILNDNKDPIIANISIIDERFREISYILGWNFHPKIIRDAMLSRLEIAKLKSLIGAEQLNDTQKKELINMYFEIDADTSAVLSALADILGVSLAKGG